VLAKDYIGVWQKFGPTAEFSGVLAVRTCERPIPNRDIEPRRV
jgi:hypothetical protein